MNISRPIIPDYLLLGGVSLAEDYRGRLHEQGVLRAREDSSTLNRIKTLAAEFNLTELRSGLRVKSARQTACSALTLTPNPRPPL